MGQYPFTGRMNRSRVGFAAGLLATAAGFAGGYWVGDRHRWEHTRVVATSCGVAPAEAPFTLPLRTLQEQASHVPLRIGPLRIPGVPTAVLLHFDPALDGRGETVVKLGNVLHLPKHLETQSPGTVFGRTASRPPEEIRLACRDGALTTVQYWLDAHPTIFSVVRQDDRSLASGS